MFHVEQLSILSMEQITSCPICNSATHSHYLTCKDYTVSNSEFTIVRCNSCNFHFTNPRPDSKSIGSFYESEEYISHSNTKKGLINKLYQLVRNYTLKQKESLISQHVSRGTLLDIGCGTGEFLNHMRKAGWSVLGIEPGEKARNFASTNYSIPVENESALLNLSPESYDLISMWHVLEHVHNLNERVKKLHELIKQDGLVVIAVPNYTSYDAEKYGAYWAAYDLPRHLYHFSPNSIQQLFAKHGFVQHKVMPMKFDSFYVSLLSEKYKYGGTNIVSAFMTGLLSNLKAKFSKDHIYSSQIYLFKKK